MEFPEELQSAISDLMAMVHHMRLGDGTIARFNGMDATSHDELAIVLAYDNPLKQPLVSAIAKQSKYARLAAGDTVLVVDAGGPPPWHVGGRAQAGCLSFEMSSGRMPIFVNCGMPGSVYQVERELARATNAHNSLCINGESSGRLLYSDFLRAQAGGYPLRYPDMVNTLLKDEGDLVLFEGAHNGYQAEFGMVHKRKLILDLAGCRLVGRDEIGARKKLLRLAKDAPFAVHFHLHPTVLCEIEPPPESGDGRHDSAVLTLANGEQWRFDTQNAQLTIEDSVFYADAAGPRGAVQIVLRSASFGESVVEWRLARMSGSDRVGD